LITAIGIAIATFAFVKLFDEPSEPRKPVKHIFNAKSECELAWMRKNRSTTAIPKSYKTETWNTYKIDDKHYKIIGNFTAKNRLGVRIMHRSEAVCQAFQNNVMITKYMIVK